MINERNATKEKYESETILLIIKTAAFFGIIYGIYRFCKLKEEKENLEKKLEEITIKNPNAWQGIEERKIEIWKNSKLVKTILLQTRKTKTTEKI